MVYCSVNGCRSSNDRRLNRVKQNPDLKNLHFYRFSKKRVYRTVCTRNGKYKTKNAYICSNHFKPDDNASNLKHELLNYCPKNSKKLNDYAIPSVNIPSVIPLPEELDDSKVIAAAVPILSSTPTPVPTNSIKPKIKIKSPQKLGINTIETMAKCAANLNTNVRQAVAIKSPDPIVIPNNSSQCNGEKRNVPQSRYCNLEVRDIDRWHELPFPIEDSTKCCVAYFIPAGFDPIISKPPDVRKSAWNVEAPGTSRWHKVQLQFLNHVIMVWVNRGRNGNPNIVMLDSMLKTKAKEAATILDTPIFCLHLWLQSFKDILRREDARQPPKYDPNLCGLSMNIADIIEDEWLRYRCEDNEIVNEIKLKDTIEKNKKIEVFAQPSIVDWDSPIESYPEALDCLTMVESYALSTRNFCAVGVVTKLENLMRLECQ